MSIKVNPRRCRGSYAVVEHVEAGIATCAICGRRLETTWRWRVMVKANATIRFKEYRLTKHRTIAKRQSRERQTPTHEHALMQSIFKKPPSRAEAA